MTPYCPSRYKKQTRNLRFSSEPWSRVRHLQRLFSRRSGSDIDAAPGSTRSGQCTRSCLRSPSRNPHPSCRLCRTRRGRGVPLRNGCRTWYQQHSTGQVRRRSRTDAPAQAVAEARHRRLEDRLRTLGPRSGHLRPPDESRGRRQLPRRGLGVDGMYGKQQPEGRPPLRPGPAGPRIDTVLRVAPSAALGIQGGIHGCNGSTAEKPCPGRRAERHGGDAPVFRAEGRTAGEHGENRRAASIAWGGSPPGRRFRKTPWSIARRMRHPDAGEIIALFDAASSRQTA